MWGRTLLRSCAALFLAFAFLTVESESCAQDCPDDEVCFFDVKGAECADGTPTGFSITYRKGAKDLFIFLDGGGACWSSGTCTSRSVKNLSAYGKYEGPYDSIDNPLNEGFGSATNSDAPFVAGYNSVFVPYCTGDAFMGNKVQDYGAPGAPNKVRHVGFHNLELILEQVQSRIPTAERVVFYGKSAGGFGVSWNIPQVVAFYPKSDVFVVNDSGVLFKAPHVDGGKLRSVYETWDAPSNHVAFTVGGRKYTPSTVLTSEVLDFTQKEFPNVRYAFIDTYYDWTMSIFAGLLKASKLTSVVRGAIIDLADHEFAASNMYQVFYLNGTNHVAYDEDPSTLSSEGVMLTAWLDKMLTRDPSWTSVRPDKSATSIARASF